MTIEAFKDALEQGGFKPVNGVPGLYKLGEWPFFTANLYQSPRIYAQKGPSDAVLEIAVETKEDLKNALNTFS